VARVLLTSALLASVWLVFEGSGVNSKLVQKYSARSRRLDGDGHGQTGEPDGSWKDFLLSLSNFFIILTPVVVQIMYNVVYYYLEVRKTPVLTGKEDVRHARNVQRMNMLGAMLTANTKNLLNSLFCLPSRAAHTFHSTNVMPYWLGWIASSCCLPCVLCWAHDNQGMHAKLGGKPRGCGGKSSCCISACFCPVCMVAKDAEALDMITEGVTLSKPQHVRMVAQEPFLYQDV